MEVGDVEYCKVVVEARKECEAASSPVLRCIFAFVFSFRSTLLH